jgi:hypothetical protein
MDHSPPAEPPQLPAAFAAQFDAARLYTDPATLVAIDHEGTILWLNSAWHAHAEAQASAQLIARFGVGTCYFDGISGELRDYYATRFKETLERKRVFEQLYDCSTPEQQRIMRLRALPVAAGGLMLEHSLAFQHPCAHPFLLPVDSRYLREDGLILQCSHCRRVRSVNEPAWEWVEAWVREPPAHTSHGLCEMCAAFYWGAHRSLHAAG